MNASPFNETLRYQSNRAIYRSARTWYKKNKLHESVRALQYLLNRQYAPFKVKVLLARCYERLSFLLRDIEYEDLAREIYENIITTARRRRRRKVIREYNRLMNRIYELNDNEYRAFIKAHQLHMEQSPSPKKWLLLGSNFNIRKDVDFVINAYRNAIELDPNYIMALYRLGYVYQFNKGDEQSAIPYYIRLVKLDPADDHNESETTNARCILDGCNQLGRIYFHKKEYRKVIALFNQALRIQSEFLPSGVLSCIRDLIYFADLSAKQIQISDTLDTHLKRVYYFSFNQLLNKYCREITVA